jgi:hypothetical protein
MSIIPINCEISSPWRTSCCSDIFYKGNATSINLLALCNVEGRRATIKNTDLTFLLSQGFVKSRLGSTTLCSVTASCRQLSCSVESLGGTKCHSRAKRHSGLKLHNLWDRMNVLLQRDKCHNLWDKIDILFQRDEMSQCVEISQIMEKNKRPFTQGQISWRVEISLFYGVKWTFY